MDDNDNNNNDNDNNTNNSKGKTNKSNLCLPRVDIEGNENYPHRRTQIGPEDGVPPNLNTVRGI